MTAEQFKALHALKRNWSYVEYPAADPDLRVDCYRGTAELKRIGTAVIRTNGFVDWWRA